MKVYGYNAGYSSNEPIRAVSTLSRLKATEIIAEVDIDRIHSTRNWIIKRITQTRNEIDIALAEKYAGKVVFYQGGRILDIR